VSRNRSGNSLTQPFLFLFHSQKWEKLERAQALRGVNGIDGWRTGIKRTPQTTGGMVGKERRRRGRDESTCRCHWVTNPYRAMRSQTGGVNSRTNLYIRKNHTFPIIPIIRDFITYPFHIPTLLLLERTALFQPHSKILQRGLFLP
jgi:hypothetical protein